MSQIVDVVLDTTGLNCPEPVMLLHRSVRSAKIGDIIEVIATDPATLRDIPNFCEFLGHELLQNTEDSGSYRYLIRKA